jgi:hypothetical protein
VLDCLLYAIPEKTQVQKHFGLKYGYIGYGVPETLVVDQGKEMLGRDLEEACLQLGIKLVHNPGRSPWMKGSIERWFGALNTDMVHALPGTTFSHVLERGDYRSEHVACVSARWTVGVITSLDCGGLYEGISQRECARGASQTVGAGDGERVCAQIASESRSVSGLVITTSGENGTSVWN